MNMKLEAERIGKSTDWLVGQSFNGKQGLYAILDAAREGEIPQKLYQHGAEFVSLYRGEPEEKLASVSPYLIKIDTKPKTIEWILNEGWGNSWGIFLVSSAGVDDLRRHFRRLLLVESPESKELYFRFYDPRVLRVYLPTCTPFEAKRFFGPVSAYLMESEDGQAFQEFSRGGNRTITLSDLDWAGMPDSDGVGQTRDESNSPRTNQRLRIREEQMKAFSDYMYVSFEKRVAAHLRKEQPERTKALTGSNLDKFIQAGVIRAQNRGFSREADLGVFLEVMLLLGINFDEKPDWAQFFENRELTSTEKIDRLRQLRDEKSDRGLNKDE